MAKLLFVHTFSHDTIEDFNIDFVKFSAGALATVREIRIIPGGARIPVAEAPQRQGLTSPNSFGLEVFAKNFKQSDAAVFERIAVFDYHFDSDIRFQISPYTTDGMLFKGKYIALTVAIYGDPVSGDTDLSQSPSVSTLGSMDHGSVASAAATVPSGGGTFATTPSDAGLLASSSVFPADASAQILTVGTPIPTWVGPLPTVSVPPVMHMPPPATYNPLVPPPISVITPYSPAPGTPGPAAVFGPGPAHTAGGVVLPALFDPTRPPPTFLTPQHSPQIVAQQSQVSPSEQLLSHAPLHRRQQEQSGKGKRRNISESAKGQPEGKNVEAVSTGKTGPSMTSREAIQHGLSGDHQLEEGEYANSEGETEKFDLENISDEEFEFDDTVAAEMNESELQEDLLSSVRFDPYSYVMKPLKHFKNPAFSSFEAEVHGNNPQGFTSDAEKLIAVLESCETGVFNEKWVHSAEDACNLVFTGLVHIFREGNRTDVVDRLVQWTVDGLDVDKACQQQTFCTLRHLKAGIRLATLLFQTVETVSVKLCNVDVQHRLLDVLDCDATSTPVMLLIVNALDASIFFGAGFDAFLLVSADSNKQYRLTPFQRLTRFIMKKRPSRVMVAIHRFMQKIVLHKSLKTIFSTAKKISERANSSEAARPNGDDQSSVASSDAEAVLEEDDIISLCENIVRITNFYCNARDVLCQPPRGLPTSAVFTLSSAPNDPYPAIYAMFNRHHLLPCLYLLLCNWTNRNEPRAVTAIHQLLWSLLSNDSGLLYLASNRNVVQEMLQLLLQKADECSEDEGTSLMQDYGLDLAYHLQCLHYVDSLMYFHCQRAVQSEVDNPEVLKKLQSFYVLTLDSHSNDRQGVRAAVHVLSQQNNLGAILPFVELIGDPEWDNKIKKSACAGYASDLLLLVLRYAESLDYLKIFHERILTISSQEVTSKIAEVKQWTEPLRKLPGFTFESLEYLADRIKTFVKNEAIVPRIPKGLITALRLTYHIAVEPQRQEDIERPNELRYNYALVQLHYHGTLSVLLELIEKLVDSQVLNWQQGISLNNKHGHSFYACVVPAIGLIRSILSYLIHCRGSEFKDLTPIGPLLKLYTICCTLVPSFGVLREANVVRQDIITALLAFTQPETSDQGETAGQETNEIENNLWTKMVVEIINFTMGSLSRYVAGLHVLSELLPLPLPMPTKEALSVDDCLLVQHHRRLWSSHLTSISDQVQCLIRDFACSTQNILQQGLRRVCLQLSDLSASMANVVVRAVADVLLENCEPADAKRATGDVEEAASAQRALLLPATAGFARAMNLLSYMASQAAFKVCLLNLLQSRKEKPSDDYGRLLDYLLSVLNYTSTERSHRMSQELIVSTIQSLCDEEVCMILSAQGRSASEQLACSLPVSHQLQEICCALVRHVGDVSQTYATILPALRILVMLCEHDYGLECIKAALQAEHRALLSFFERLLDEFSGHSSDCISTLSTLLLLLRSLQTVEEGAPLRSKTVSAPLARQILGWELESSNDNHCLVKLERLLAGVTEEDSSLYSLHEDVNNLITMLSTGDDIAECSGNDDGILQLPPPLDLQQQFGTRQVWIICNDPSEDRLQSHYWFPPDIMDDEDDQDIERVPAELEKMIAEYLPGFDLGKEVMEKISAKRAEEAEAAKRKVTPGIINTSRGERKRFIAPLRGRGNVPRGGVTTRMNDPFRSRLPNTSRPPSMHVDDFILAQHIQSSSSGLGGAEGGDASRSKTLARSNVNRTDSDQSGVGRSNWYRATSPDSRGRTFSKPQSGALAKPYRPRENVFDRPRERHTGGAGQRGGGKIGKSSSSRKSPSRHRASSK